MEMNGDMHNENLCPFDIWAPDHRCSMNNKAFSAYAFRQQQIEDVIAALVNVDDDPNDFLVQQAAFLSAGIDSNSLSDDEITYIEREVSRRLCR